MDCRRRELRLDGHFGADWNYLDRDARAIWCGLLMVGGQWKGPGLKCILEIELFVWSDLCMWILSLDFCTENRNRLGRGRNKESCFPRDAGNHHSDTPVQAWRALGTSLE